ncbi:MAG: hypothetical protein ACI9S9_000866 [Planctomycetota bacterium]|jgi:hypothetical protein
MENVDGCAIAKCADCDAEQAKHPKPLALDKHITWECKVIADPKK